MFAHGYPLIMEHAISLEVRVRQASNSHSRYELLSMKANVAETWSFLF